jgi:hypothetical protein
MQPPTAAEIACAASPGPSSGRMRYLEGLLSSSCMFLLESTSPVIHHPLTQPLSIGGCGYSLRCLTKMPRGRRLLHSLASEAVKRRTDAPPSTTPAGRSLKLSASVSPYRKPKSRKWQEIAIATGITCSISFILSSRADERQIGFLIGGRHDQRFRHSYKSSSRF